MGYFSKLRCPICGWQLSPATWLREHSLKDEQSVGLIFYSVGKRGIRVSSPVFDPADLKLKENEKGAFKQIQSKFLRAIKNWTRWGWLDREAVLKIFGVIPLPSRGRIEQFERRFGKYSSERAIHTYDALTRLSVKEERRSISPVKKREVREYA